MSLLPKVIFIDWNKTLSNSLFWEQLNDVNHPRNKYFKDIEKAMFQKNRSLINPWMRGEHDSESIVKTLCKDSGVSEDIIFDELAESCKNMKFVSERVPDLIRDIQKKGIKVLIATDNMDTFSRFTIPAMDLEELFDGFLISWDMKVLKEDVDGDTIPFFDKYLKQNGLEYKDVVLLDDCIDGSGNYDRIGLKIVEITSPEQFVGVLEKYAS